jgi:hypothetical protein
VRREVRVHVELVVAVDVPGLGVPKLASTDSAVAEVARAALPESAPQLLGWKIRANLTRASAREMRLSWRADAASKVPAARSRKGGV